MGLDPATAIAIGGTVLGAAGGSGGSSQSGSQTTTFRPTPELLGVAFGPTAGGIPTTNTGIVGTPADVAEIDLQLRQLESELQKMGSGGLPGRPDPNKGRRAEVQNQLVDLRTRRAQILEQQGAGTFEDIDPFQGFVPEAIGSFERGEFTQERSPFFQDAINKLVEASQQTNPLQQSAIDFAQKAIAGETGSTDRLQSQIDSVLSRIGNDAQLRTQSEFNRAGRLGSPAETGVLADRVTDRAAPIVGELLARDEARRENLQAEFTKAAPALGLSPRTQLIDEAQLLSQAGGLDQAGGLKEFEALQRLGSLLGFPGSFGGQQVTPLFENKTAGRIGGALAGLELASSLGGLFGGGSS